MGIAIGVIIYKGMFSVISKRTTNDSLTSCSLFMFEEIFPTLYCTDVLFFKYMITTRLKYVSSNYMCVLITSCRTKRTSFKIFNCASCKTYLGPMILE